MGPVTPDAIEAAIRRQLDPLTPDGRARTLHVATHESAHAVVGYLVGDRPIVEVAIMPWEGRGQVRRESLIEDVGEDEALLRSRCQRAIVSLYAGLAASLRLGVRDWSGSRADLDRIACLTDDYVAVPRSERNDYLDPLRAIAERATVDAWPLIEELATLLQRRRTLPGAKVERFLSLRARGLRAIYAGEL